MPSILVVEDDAAIADAVVYALRRDGMMATFKDPLPPNDAVWIQKPRAAARGSSAARSRSRGSRPG